MQSNQFRRTRVAAAVAGLALALGAGQAFGAAFALQEQSVSGLGNAYAGGAAAAEDASTVWTNPAGMSRISTIQIVAGLNIITPSIKFNDNGSVHALNQPLGGTGGDAGSTNYVPNMYIVVPINPQFAFGLGIGAPFGLVTEWDNGWIGRYQALKSDIKTLNVNPAFSWKVAPNFSLGIGVDYQQINATLSNSLNYSALLYGACAGSAACSPNLANVAAATAGLDGNVNIKGDDSAWGWDIGALWDITPDMRVGAHYRSSLKYNVSGNVNITLPTVPKTGSPALDGLLTLLSTSVNADPRLQNGGVTSSIELPSITNVSYFGHINPQWDVMADVQFTNWSTIQDLTFVRTTGAVLGSTPEHFKDVWRFSVGASYYLDNNWKFRGGLAYDQSPVQNEFRTPRLPDASRTWLSLGAQYTMDKNLKFDGGFTYIWGGNPTISQNAGSTAQSALISGDFKPSVTIFGVSATYSF